MEKTQTKMVNSKKELREFVDFLMDLQTSSLMNGVVSPQNNTKIIRV